MSHRPSFRHRRRRLLRLHVADSIDFRLEPRSTVTPVGAAAALSIAASPALGEIAGLHATGGVMV